MLKNYFKLALRNLKNNIKFSLINVIGLVIGISISSIIMLFLINELSYDSYHKDADLIYRIDTKLFVEGGSVISIDRASAPLGPYLVETYPDIVSQTRISGLLKIKLNISDNLFEEDIFYSDPSIFQIFSYKLLAGDLNTFDKPNSIVLTESTAKKLFGKENPVGKTITGNKDIYTIVAVIDDIPENTQFKFDILGSFSSLYLIDEYKDHIDGWGLHNRYKNFTTYIKLKKNGTSESVLSKLSKVVDLYLSDSERFKYSFELVPLKEIYLYHGGGGDIRRIIQFSIIGLLLLIIPCINYINLNTSLSIKRLKEIGVKKVLGATKGQLRRQFIFESFLFSFLSLIIAFFIALQLLPVFNHIYDKNLAFSDYPNGIIALGFIALAFFTGLLSGIYPAFYLSSFKSTEALKSRLLQSSKKAIFRNILIVFQFGVSLFLICYAGVVLMQLKLLNNKELGFQTKNVVKINLNKVNRYTKLLSVRDELLRIPGVENISLASGAPVNQIMLGHYNYDEFNERKLTYTYYCDQNYVSLLQFNVLKGNCFVDKEFQVDGNVLINETLANELPWEDPIGKEFHSSIDDKQKYKIIGVVKDFCQSSYHNKIKPAFIAFTKDPTKIHAILVHLDNQNTEKIVSGIVSTCEDLSLQDEVEPKSLELEVKNKYTNEAKTGTLFIFFAIVAIFISVIGLYGLSLFVVEQKLKEIAIRKIFGSDSADIIKLLLFHFLKFIVISIIIAIPVTWYIANKWLQSFAYKFDKVWLILVLAAVILSLVAIATIFKQTIKVAFSNPVDHIKYE